MKLNKPVEVYIGNMDYDLEFELTEEYRQKYSPFLISFNSFEEFIRWNKDKVKPLLKSCWYVRIDEELRYNMFIVNIELLKELNLDYVKLQYFIKPKDRFTIINNLSDDIMDVKTTFEVKREIVDNLLKNILAPITWIEYEQLRRLFISRVGYNINMLRTYANKALELQTISIYNIRKILPKKKLSSIENIMMNILNKNKIYIKEYYDMCDRYSVDWVNDYIKSVIDNVIRYKKKISDGEIKYHNIKSSESLKSLIPLIRDIPLNRLLALKLCIMKYDSAGVEIYLLSNTSKLLDAFSTEYKMDEYDFSNKKVIISYE